MLASRVLSCLGVALFEVEPDGGKVMLSAQTPPPEWVARVWSQRGDGSWDFGGPFSFLDNFLEDARRFWAGAAAAGQPGASLPSEPWTQIDREGAEIGLKALAISFPEGSMLVVEPLGASFEFSRQALQKAHDRGLENYRLESQAVELIERSEETDRLNRLKRDFLAQMSHELRTPLNSIVGFSTLLAQGKGGELNARQMSYVSNVLTASKHLHELIDDVMDLSRIEAGHFPLTRSTFEIAEIGSQLAVLVGPKAAAKNIDLRFEIPDGAEITADRLRLSQILGNLLGNAIKFTPADGRVSLRVLRPAAGGVQFAVEDTGAGILPTELPYIFDKFQQFPKAGGSGSRGAGLGLAIAKGLVDLHGGTIDVRSETGVGSVFVVELPQ